MNTMHYGGYAARIDFDAEDRILVGHLAGINDIVGSTPTQSKASKQRFRRPRTIISRLAGS